MRGLRLLVACTVAGVLGVAACTEEGTDEASTGDRSAASTVERPPGPAADLSEEITGANAPFIGAATGLAVPEGYVEHEYVAAGEATAYQASGALGADGRWTFVPTTTAPYRTRVLVRRPADPAHASGTVIVEWLNVSGGLDANPDYATLVEEITRQGHTWVGVSAQLIGVAGGPVLVSVPGTEDITGKGLVALDPARYATLEHPGDGYAFDIYTQVARAAREGGPAFGDVAPEVVLAAGESQSAIALTTYYDGVQPLTRAYDGFFVHSRGAAGLPLVGPGEHADLAGSVGETPTILRTDLDAPVFELQAESDVVGVLASAEARQPDSDTFVLWEVAGTAHADQHLLGEVVASIDCGVEVNDGPLHIVAKAALRALDAWVRAGEPPPTAPRLELTEGAEPEVVRDADGIAVGGLRTPPVDVPVVALSGEPGPSDQVICLLLGSTTPLAPEVLAARYRSRAAYEERYEEAVDATIAAGYVLADDRDALLGDADPSRVAA